MPDEPSTPPTSAVPRIPITLIGPGTPDEGDRRGVTPIPTGTTVTAITPDHHPDLAVTFVGPVVAILVRFAYTFGNGVVGLLTAAMTPMGSKLLYTGDFLHLLLTCASLAFPIAAVGLIKDCVTIFGRLERKFPLASGSV